MNPIIITAIVAFIGMAAAYYYEVPDRSWGRAAQYSIVATILLLLAAPYVPAKLYTILPGFSANVFVILLYAAVAFIANLIFKSIRIRDGSVTLMLTVIVIFALFSLIAKLGFLPEFLGKIPLIIN